MILLDVNVLIALGDPDHVHRQAAEKFLAIGQSHGWATCPLTENAFLRILGHPGYPKGPGTPQRVRRLLFKLTALPGHQFWSDDISLTDSKALPTLPASKAITDFYLLALAIKHGARLATFDRRIDPALIPGGPAAYQVLKG